MGVGKMRSQITVSQCRNLEEALAIDYVALDVNLKRFLKAGLASQLRDDMRREVRSHCGPHGEGQGG